MQSTSRRKTELQSIGGSEGFGQNYNCSENRKKYKDRGKAIVIEVVRKAERGVPAAYGGTEGWIRVEPACWYEGLNVGRGGLKREGAGAVSEGMAAGACKPRLCYRKTRLGGRAEGFE